MPAPRRAVTIASRVLACAVPCLGLAYLVVLLTRGDAELVPAVDFGLGNGTIVLAGLMCLFRAFWVPRDRVAWALIGLSPLMYVVGNVYYYGWLVDRETVPYPSWADAGWLAVYPCFAVGLVLLVRGTFRGRGVGLWLDGLTSGLGAAAIVGVLVLRPLLSTSGDHLSLVLTNLAYPVFDMVLLSVLVMVFNLLGWRADRVWWLVTWTVVVLLVSDVVYLLQMSAGTYRDGGVLDAGWALAYMTLAPAAWLPEARRRLVAQTRASVLVPTVLSSASTALLFAGSLRTLPLVVALFGLGAVLVGTIRLTLAVVETRRLMRAQAEARTDELTGLPNRRYFLEDLRQRLAAREKLTVMILDLDGFKKVNDALGHPVGDVLLQVIGERLRRGLRSDQVLVARLGGDEFAAVVSGGSERAAIDVADRLRSLVREPVELSGITLAVGASVGCAMAPYHGADDAQLLSRADAAMYEAKRRGTGVEVFSPDRDGRTVDQLALLGELRAALTAGQLELWYQPVYSVLAGDVVSVEALIRWRHPVRGLLSPAEFLPLAVEAGLTRQLTDVVLHTACSQAAAWEEQGHGVPIAVNLFPSDLTDPSLTSRVRDACALAGLPARLLSLELTESTTADVVEHALPVLRELRDAGHTLLLDDFGTGHSSLSFLHDLPIAVVKLDRSFLTRIDTDSGRAVVLAAVQVAHVLGLTITAEGVETDAMWAAVRTLGCDTAQGFLMSAPTPSDKMTVLLRQLARREPEIGALPAV